MIIAAETLSSQPSQAGSLWDMTVLGQYWWLTYVIYGVMMLGGVALWGWGHRLLRWLIVAATTLLTLVWAYRFGSYLAINMVLSCLIGVILGAWLGYFLYRLWLGLLVTGTVIVIAVSVARNSPPWEWMFRPSPPSPQASRVPSRPNDNNQARAPIPAGPHESGDAQHREEPTLQQGLELKASSDSFTAQLVRSLEAARRLLGQFQRDVPGLDFIAAAALVASLAGSLAIPRVMAVALTSLVGLALVLWGGIGLVDGETGWTSHWINDHQLTAGLVLALGWVLGMALQYWQLPQPAPAGGQERDGEADEDEADDANAGKSKSKK